jgi:hypothetical protein
VTTTRSLSEILPREMTELRVRPLFILLLDVQPAINVGNTPGVDRRVGVITGGRFEGERLRGTLLPGGSDWQAVRPGDGAWMLDVRVVLKTDDEHIIGMTYRGMRHGPKDVLDRIARGEMVKATDYYLRIAPFRDRVGKVRLAQPHRQHRCRTPVARRSSLPSVRGSLNCRHRNVSRRGLICEHFGRQICLRRLGRANESMNTSELLCVAA